MSSQIGCPDGASAEWPSDMPSASPTTCEVAAVPRNWQPPPGEAQARQPRSAASCSEISGVHEAHADRLDARRRPRPRSGSSVTPPGTSTHGRSCIAGERHHHRRQALVAGRDAEHAAAGRQRADQPAEDRRRVVAIGRLSNIAGVPCERPSHGSVQAPANGIAPAALNSRAAASISRPTSQWPV